MLVTIKKSDGTSQEIDLLIRQNFINRHFNEEEKKLINQLNQGILLSEIGSSINSLSMHGNTFEFSSPTIIDESEKHYPQRVLRAREDKPFAKGKYGGVFQTTKLRIGTERHPHQKEKILKLQEISDNQERRENHFKLYQNERDHTKKFYSSHAVTPKEDSHSFKMFLPNLGQIDLFNLVHDRSSLRKYFKGFSEKVSTFMGLAKNLAKAHALGIVHRDLKPDNILQQILYGESGHIIRRMPIIDWGVSEKNGTDPVIHNGSAGYAAPEQLVLKAVTYKSDIYACGRLLMECLFSWQAIYEIAEYKHETNIQYIFETFLSKDTSAFIPKNKKTILTKLILSMVDPNPEIRPNIQDVIWVLSLLQLSDNGLNFLAEHTSPIELNEKIKLFFLLKQTDVSLIPYRNSFLSTLGFDLEAIQQQLSFSPPDNLSILDAITDGHVDIKKAVLSKTFAKDFSVLGLKYHSEFYPIEDYKALMIFALNFKNIYHDTLYYADQLSEQYGMDYTDETVLAHLNQYAALCFQAIEDPEQKIEFFRQLPKCAQAVIRNENQVMAIELSSAFHGNLKTLETATDFFQEQPNWHFIFIQEQRSKQYHLILKDNDEVKSYPIFVNDNKFSFNGKVYDSIKALLTFNYQDIDPYSALTRLNPILEPKEPYKKDILQFNLNTLVLINQLISTEKDPIEKSILQATKEYCEKRIHSYYLFNLNEISDLLSINNKPTVEKTIVSSNPYSSFKHGDDASNHKEKETTTLTETFSPVSTQA